MTSLAERWQAFSDRSYPADARGKPIEGVDLNQIDTFASIFLGMLARGETLEANQYGVLLHCHRELSRVLPALSGEAHDYFAELDALVVLALGQATMDPFHFANMIGEELHQLLARRAEERLAGKSDQERLPAVLGAALVVVAETLRGPVETADDPGQMIEKMIAFSSDWLRKLLEPAAGKK
jgi:hypothetical protein